MNFASIMKTLATGLACKRPSWKGYVKKVAPASGDKMSDGTTAVAYWVHFVQADGDTFRYRVSDAGVAEYVAGSGEAASALSLDGGLLAAMLSSDWVWGDPADFEAARTTTGGIW